MSLKFGTYYLTKSLTAKGGLDRQAPTGQYKASPGTLDVVLSLGRIEPGVQFSPEGALLALGYGPVVFTHVTRDLVDALLAAKTYVEHPDEERKDEILAQIDAALRAAGAFKDKTDAVLPQT